MLKNVRTRITVPILVVCGLTMTPLLSGCALPFIFGDHTPRQNSANNYNLPAGFPTEIPLVSGTMRPSFPAGGGPNSPWYVIIDVPSDMITTFDSVTTQLQQAGFALSNQTDIVNVRSGLFMSDDYGMFISVTRTENNNSAVSYTIQSEPS